MKTHAIALLATAATAASTATLGAAAPAIENPKSKIENPNILFCIADDASFAHFSANGCTWVNTPAFDRVAREGILFSRAYTPNAKCGPSRSCILTGRNSWQLEAAANHNAYYPKGYTTFMEALGANGYYAGCTAKGWAPGNPGQVDGKPRQLTGIPYNTAKTTPPTRDISSIDYAANFAAFLADWQKQNQSPDTPAPGAAAPNPKSKIENPKSPKPFAFWYGSHEPHRKYAPGSGVALGGKKTTDIDRVPPCWPDTEAVRNDMLDYAFEVEYFDTQLGRMLALLEKLGELDNTIIVVTSDNGMPFPRGKGGTYELSTHMPLAIRWPAGIKNPGRRAADYVSFVDLAPTFMELARVDPATAGMMPITGKSLAPILRDDYNGQIAPGRDTLIGGRERHDIGRPGDVGYPVRGIFIGDWLYLHNFEPARWPMGDPLTGYHDTDSSPTKTAVLDENRAGINHWRWALDFGRRPADELYNLKTDPDCMNNQAANPANAARKDAMREKLFAMLKEQRDPRMEGKGDIFDKYPTTTPDQGLYNRVLRGEKVDTGGFSQTDFESPNFDPERPLSPNVQPMLAPAQPGPDKPLPNPSRPKKGPKAGAKKAPKESEE